LGLPIHERGPFVFSPGRFFLWEALLDAVGQKIIIIKNGERPSGPGCFELKA